METKTCSLTDDEIEQLIIYHGQFLHDDKDNRIERIIYLNRRLKAKKDQPKAELPIPPAQEQKVATW